MIFDFELVNNIIMRIQSYKLESGTRWPRVSRLGTESGSMYGLSLINTVSRMTTGEYLGTIRYTIIGSKITSLSPNPRPPPIPRQAAP